jgi:Tol biopolymer transport system component/tRNA A-37 threonylcarbamoyl transferase component Bud32
MNEARPRSPGRYRLLSLIGEGGMGRVYRGFDSTLRRNVAIKVLPPELVADRSRLSRFIREARAASALNHPNVVTIYDIGEERLEGQERVHYIAMELVEGQTLRERVDGQPLEIREGLRIAMQIAEGLAAAHAVGIIHRDLKPENIMINASGVAKVLDFGLAKLREPEQRGSDDSDGVRTLVRSTEPGMVVGTAGYMSPEQARGSLLDARSDLFSFGCVLYEIAAGREAFQGDSAVETMHAIIHAEPVSIRDIRPDAPAELERIVRKALAKDREERYQSASELAADLRGLLHELESPQGARRRAPPTARLTLAATAFGLLAVAGTAFMLTRRWRGPEAGGEALQIRPITAIGKVIEAAISPDAKLTAYVVSDQGQQTLAVREMVSGQTLTLIPPRRSSYWGLAFTPDSSTIYFAVKDNADRAGAIYRISTLGGRPQKIVDAVDSPPTFSPDGKRMAFLRAGFPTREESAVLIGNADGSGVRTLAKIHAPEFFVPIFFAGASWSPDGKLIATAVVGRELTLRRTTYFTPKAAHVSRIVAIDVADGSMRTIADHRWGSVAQVAWMPDQKGLVAVAAGESERSYQVWYVRYPGGEAQPVTHDVFDYRLASLSADGKSLVTVASQINADLWIVREGAGPHRITASRSEGLYGIAALPDGRIATTSIETGKIDLFVTNRDGGGRVRLTRDEFFNLLPAATPDGKRIVYLALTPRGPEICRMNADGSGRTVLARTAATLARLDISPDGKSVIYEDFTPTAGRAGFVGIARVSIDGGPGSTRLGTENMSAPVFSPDGSKIAGLLSDDDGSTCLAIKPSSGGPAVKVAPWTATTYSMTRWTRDGKALVVNAVENDYANLWMIPLDGSPRRKLTGFDEHIIFTFAPLAPEEGWILSRGELSRDAVLITGFRPPD